MKIESASERRWARARGLKKHKKKRRKKNGKKWDERIRIFLNNVLDSQWKVPCSVELFYHSILQDENIFCKVNKGVKSYNEKEKRFNLVLDTNASIDMIECWWKTLGKVNLMS